MGKNLKGKELGRGLTQRADGRYMGRAQVNGHKILLYNMNLSQLKKDLAKKIEEVKRGDLDVQCDMTLNEWFEIWYNTYKAPVLKNGGSAQYKRQYLNYYGSRIGEKKLSEIRPLHVQTAIADLLEAGRGSKSIREATGILSQCTEVAMANGLMRINPTVGAIIPKESKVKRRVLSEKEQQIFLAYIHRMHSWYEELYQIMLLTGMRIGEIGGLWWEDINFTEGFIYVKRSLLYTYHNGKMILQLSSPKTTNSYRKIPFFGETKAILKSQFSKMEMRKKELGDRWRKPEELGNLVFLTSLGSPVGRYIVERDLNSIVNQINAILKESDNPMQFDKIYPHALRHTFATRCFEKNMAPRIVQEIMGHVNYNTTVSYTHVLDDMKTEEAKRVGDFLKTSIQDDSDVDYSKFFGII